MKTRYLEYTRKLTALTEVGFWKKGAFSREILKQCTAAMLLTKALIYRHSKTLSKQCMDMSPLTGWKIYRILFISNLNFITDLWIIKTCPLHYFKHLQDPLGLLAFLAGTDGSIVRDHVRLAPVRLHLPGHAYGEL